MLNWSNLESLIKDFNQEKRQNLETYMELLQQENKKYNLTAIVESQEIIDKHFYDSVIFSESIEIENQSIMDIGTGAGFPGLVIKILFPETKVYLVESNNKKISFLNLVINKLNLKNVFTKNERAEDFSLEMKEKFDIIISRAMAPLNILLEVGVQGLKVGGQFICLKSKNVTNEILDLNNKESVIGLKLLKEQKISIDNIGERINLFYLKEKNTPNSYPRMYSQIKKKPLGK
ncbi:16S rRNA methyltransferase GidB [Spiroplasma chinense]|uniref:Ribosomal RNA small subunit methyltransferase G n=1 Tax=Spiroplasma chinense TaxID=216932 RepID=A0A5B9Y5T8_9MOLU|nr:16S rRNA (guanine(527)-N(7))-methyltransferase RsmG [Spiroplasma chinense]QEH62394.1 16S rRNA methyltransferase GidB [Spiroplasma chinense]